MLQDSASLSVMVEGIGSRSARWLQLKREDFWNSYEQPKACNLTCNDRQESRLKHGMSSLSSSSGNNDSSNGTSSEEEQKLKETTTQDATTLAANNAPPTNKVSSGSGTGSSQDGSCDSKKKPEEQGLHDYHAKPLPDPKLSGSSEDSPSDTPNGNSDDTNEEDDEYEPSHKRAKVDPSESAGREESRGRSQSSSSSRLHNLPPNIAKKGGIPVPHSVQRAASASTNGRSRLNSSAPAISLPPFGGLGGKRQRPAENVSIPAEHKNDETPAVIAADNDTSSSSNNSVNKSPAIRAYYHMNEDDMILMEDFLMCPFVFRSQDAVMNGALAECVMPGMLRAHFSNRNKLNSIEMVYDAMGFMQQLERAGGSEGSFQIIPGSLEMALAPSSEARVITTAQAPFLIVNVNEAWTQTTGYTQMEAEGKEYKSLLEGEGSVGKPLRRSGKPLWDLAQISTGQAACTTDVHYHKDGTDFLEFICSYPLTNATNEVTHLLHVHKELPSS